MANLNHFILLPAVSMTTIRGNELLHFHGYIGDVNRRQHNTCTFSVFLGDMCTMFVK